MQLSARSVSAASAPGEELWFQFTLAEAGAIVEGTLVSLRARPAS